MRGTMMDRPLLISQIIEHAARRHGTVEVVSRRADGRFDRSCYREIEERARRLAAALKAAGAERPARVATLAFNSREHLELFYAIAGSGLVCHTLNPRLTIDQVRYIFRHGGAALIFHDRGLTDMARQVGPGARLIAIDDGSGDGSPTGTERYEHFLDSAQDALANWPTLNERTASGLCYTSGTTGRPKGVLYTHRSTVLHALSSLSASCLGFTPEDVVCPIVSMYHVNAWGVPFSAPMAGCKLVLPGRRLDGESLADLFDAEGVTVALGVPTVFHQLLDYLDRTGRRLSSLRRVGIGGSALSAAQVDRLARIGVEAIQLWGMTETSPLGTSSRPTPADRRNATSGETEIRAAQGRFLFGIEGAVLDDGGKPLPRDGKSIGELAVRGHWVTKGYYRQKASGSADEWFRTGDLATIDANDVMRLVDRRKDVIKSGGEWISSVELENAATAHPDVALAAAIGVAHAKWDERPLLIVVPRPGTAPTAEDLKSFLAKSYPNWMLPDDVVFMDTLPQTSTGKILKSELRDQFKTYFGAIA